MDDRKRAEEIVARFIGSGENVEQRRASCVDAIVAFVSEVRAEQGIPSCAICGSARVLIRGRFPRDPERKVCPTCVTERLEQICQIASMEYGAANHNDEVVEHG